MNDIVTSRIISWILALLFFLSSATGFSVGKNNPDPTLEQPKWPTWVHEHWVWENSGDQDSIADIVADYQAHDVPVGAIIIDRPWSLDVGSFVPDPKLYPDLASEIKRYHAMGIKVLLWSTCMVNEGSPNFQEGKDKGYYLSWGQTVKWWGGKGAFVDYTNPEAVKWWHKQMDVVLDMGIDGWKVDGADPYVMTLIPPIGYGGKYMTWGAYQKVFYQDFFQYTREKLGNDRIIFTRPVDDLPLRVGFPLTFATKDNNFAGWVGDEDSTWGGLRSALNDMMTSARYNYVSYGTDIYGFRGGDEKNKDLYLRWTQLDTFCSVMENGNVGGNRPWSYDQETTDLYRNFVNLHTELIPYIYSQGAYSYELGKPTMRPQLGTYEYLLGDDLLVAPIFEEGNERTVVFPKGDWIYMFDNTKQYSMGIKKLSFGLNEYPVFIRKGAIIPLDTNSKEPVFGAGLSDKYTTVAMYPAKGEKKFGLYEENTKGSMISYKKDDSSLTINCTPTNRSMIFRVYGEPAPQIVQSAFGIEYAKASSLADLMTRPTGYYTDGTITYIAMKDLTAGTQIEVRY